MEKFLDIFALEGETAGFFSSLRLEKIVVCERFQPNFKWQDKTWSEIA